MSRSYRQPYSSRGDSSMKDWKKQANQAIRRTKGEIPDGKYYKRIEDNWTSPRDGKQQWDNTDPKLRRK